MAAVRQCLEYDFSSIDYDLIRSGENEEARRKWREEMRNKYGPEYLWKLCV